MFLIQLFLIGRSSVSVGTRRITDDLNIGAREVTLIVKVEFSIANRVRSLLVRCDFHNK